MRGFPKTIQTAQDVENCFDMVQAGQLDAVKFQEKLEAIGRRAYLHCPITEITGNRRTATIRFCNEAMVGVAGNTTITAVKHIPDPNPPEGGAMEEGNAFTVLTLEAPLPAGETKILIPAPVAPFVSMGMATARFTSIGAAIETAVTTAKLAAAELETNTQGGTRA